MKKVDAIILFVWIQQICVKLCSTQPQFGQSVYQTSIPDTIATGQIVYSLQIQDYNSQNASAPFHIELVNNNDVFYIQPSSGSGTVSASIVVADSSKIDYLIIRSYNLTVVATDDTSLVSTSANVLVTVQPIRNHAPQFAQSTYTTEIIDNALPGTVAITVTATDPDPGLNGETGLSYKLQLPSGINLFQVDPRSGAISVANCFTPGIAPCLDYTHQATYNFQLIVRDKNGEGLQATTNIVINLIDADYNPVSFVTHYYSGFILENTYFPNPPIIVQATNSRNATLTYSLVGGNVDYWIVGAQSGEIKAARLITYNLTPNGQGFYDLTVMASDGTNNDTCSVHIGVNRTGSPPTFYPDNFYEATIAENSPPGTFVLQVNASLDNLLPFDYLSYSFQSEVNNFVIGQATGIIQVSSAAVFNAAANNLYELTVMASDHAIPPHVGSATVNIHITPVAAPGPRFSTGIVYVSVSDAAPVGSSLVRMAASTSNPNARLYYSFAAPQQAFTADKLTISVQTFNFSNLFTIGATNGEVTVRASLSQQPVAYFSTGVVVVDFGSTGNMSAQATLVITIIPTNMRAPIVLLANFSNGKYMFNISIPEKLPLNSYIMTVMATSYYTRITGYKMVTPSDYFSLNSQTGVVTVKSSVIYRDVQFIQFSVVASDGGIPLLNITSLNSTVIINVNVLNSNSFTPSFSQVGYYSSILESASSGAIVRQVTASDLDVGTYGTISYAFVENQAQFAIDSTSGLITVAQGGFNHEQTPVIQVTVAASDSPSQPWLRHTQLAPVFISILPVNSLNPIFTQSAYSAIISETFPIGSNVIQISATSVIQDTISYNMLVPDPFGLFSVSSMSGQVTVSRSLKNYAGVYNITIAAWNTNSASNRNSTLVTITVLPAITGTPPVWKQPNTDFVSYSVLENQYLGLLVTQVMAESNGSTVLYGFYNDAGQFVTQTGQFAINQYTGWIKALEVFSRARQNLFLLHLVARTTGNPSYEATRYIVIHITQTGYVPPQFPLYQNCCVIPVLLSYASIPSVNTLLFTARAVDISDYGFPISYTIISGNTNNLFSVDQSSGNVYMVKQPDSNMPSHYKLQVQASETGTPSFPQLPANCRCSDQSTLDITIDLPDLTLSPFANQFYDACVADDAPMGRLVKSVNVVSMTDTSNIGVSYTITATLAYTMKQTNYTVVPDAFVIDPTNGSLFTNVLMTNFTNYYFAMQVVAKKQSVLGASVATARVFVTSASNRVTVTIDLPIDSVRNNLESLQSGLQRMTQMGIICIDDIRYSVSDAGILNTNRTDVFIYVVSPGLYVMDANAAIASITANKLTWLTYSIIAVKATQSSLWKGFIIDAVLGAVITVLILLLLALILLILLCCLYWCCPYKRDLVFAVGSNIDRSAEDVQELTMKLGSGNDAYTLNKMTLTGSYANPAYETTEVTTQRTESTFETRRSALRTTSANGHRPVSIPELDYPDEMDYALPRRGAAGDLSRSEPNLVRAYEDNTLQRRWDSFSQPLVSTGTMTDLALPDYSTMGSVFYPSEANQRANFEHPDGTPKRTILKQPNAPKPYRIGATLSKSEPEEYRGMRVVSDVIYDISTVQSSDDDQIGLNSRGNMPDSSNWQNANNRSASDLPVYANSANNNNTISERSQPTQYEQFGQFVNATRKQYEPRSQK